MNTNRKLILYIAMSLDGYIAKPNDDLSFLSIVDKEGEDYGYNDFMSTVDTVITGRKTYDWINQHNLPQSGKDTYIITRSARPDTGKTKFYSGDLTELIYKLKIEKGKDIFCEGGAEIVTELLNHNLIDEFIISIIPVIVGKGIRLFKEGIPEQRLELLSAKSFESGLTQLHYKQYDNMNK